MGWFSFWVVLCCNVIWVGYVGIGGWVVVGIGVGGDGGCSCVVYWVVEYVGCLCWGCGWFGLGCGIGVWGGVGCDGVFGDGCGKLCLGGVVGSVEFVWVECVCDCCVWIFVWVYVGLGCSGYGGLLCWGFGGGYIVGIVVVMVIEYFWCC